MNEINEPLPSHYGATPRIFNNAKKLKRRLTKAEIALWKILRGRNLEGLKFRRQHPIQFFIADFYCHELKLVVEIDGSIHLLKEVKEYDRKRDEIMRELGLIVLRFTNEQVFFQVEDIEARILEVKRKYEGG